MHRISPVIFVFLAAMEAPPSEVGRRPDAVSDALAIIRHESGKRLGLLTWGLIPSWTKEKKGTGHINARVETLDKKPSFRESFLKRRCLIIADGFYEWKADPENGNSKIRYHIQPPSPSCIKKTIPLEKCTS